MFFFLMIRRPPRSTRTDTLFPYTTLFRSAADVLTPARQAVLMPIARYAAANLPCEVPIALLRDWETPIPAKPEALAMWRAVCSLLLRSEEHTSELQSLMRISYAVFCLQQKKNKTIQQNK